MSAKPNLTQKRVILSAAKNPRISLFAFAVAVFSIENKLEKAGSFSTHKN
jgi:hypothetical protein